MRGYIDLHCHWVSGIDDGAKSVEDSLAMLTGLYRIGFDVVCATPHMRPNLFDNSAEQIRTAYQSTVTALTSSAQLPKLMLSSEHYFDGVVFQRLMEGQALPYPGNHSVLIEFPYEWFPAQVTHRFFNLQVKRLRPVLAHPERYEPVWKDMKALGPLVDGGTVLLLDVAALMGKYGRTSRRTAEKLLEEGYYYAACSDAHAPKDIVDVQKGIETLISLVGEEEAQFLLQEGPQRILNGTVDS